MRAGLGKRARRDSSGLGERNEAKPSTHRRVREPSTSSGRPRACRPVLRRWPALAQADGGLVTKRWLRAQMTTMTLPQLWLPSHPRSPLPWVGPAGWPMGCATAPSWLYHLLSALHLAQTRNATKNQLPRKETRIAYLNKPRHAFTRRQPPCWRRKPPRRSQPIVLARRSSPIARNAQASISLQLALDNNTINHHNNRCIRPSLASLYAADCPRCPAANFFARCCPRSDSAFPESSCQLLLPFRPNSRTPDWNHGCRRNPPARLQPRRRLREPLGHCQHTHTTRCRTRLRHADASKLHIANLAGAEGPPWHAGRREVAFAAVQGHGH